MAIKITEDGAVKYVNENDVDRTLFPNLSGAMGDEQYDALNGRLTVVEGKVSDLEECCDDVNTDIGAIKNDFIHINDVLGVETITGSKTTEKSKYTVLASPFALSEGVTYSATFTIPEAISENVYCYIIDNTDSDNNNLYPGNTALVAGNTSHTVQFTPTKDYADVRASVWVANIVTASVIIDPVPANKIVALEEKTANLRPFEYGHNGLKTSVFMGYGLWAQGCARIKDTLVGFNASNDEHTNTSNYTSMHYSNGYSYNASGNHNLGHCASADYNKDTDVLIVANGTYADGVVPTVYFISNAYAVTDAGTDILVDDANVSKIEFNNIEGAGCVACFGETSKIIYVVTSSDPAHPYNNNDIYIYKLVLGMGSVDMVSLHPSASFGSFVSGKADTEYNGTAYILCRYVAKYPIELQGMKFCNGRLVMSVDTLINNIKTGYLLFIKTYDDNSFIIDEAKWIPSLDNNGNYVVTEPEGFAVADGTGYITVYRNGMQSNTSMTLAFSLID